jgi:hypothetical protein
MRHRGQSGHMPFVALVAGRHERFSAQGSTLAAGLDSLSLKTGPTWGIDGTLKAAVGRHSDHRRTPQCEAWPNIPGITELGNILTVVSDPADATLPRPVGGGGTIFLR